MVPPAGRRDALQSAIESLREKILRLQDSRGLNEETTKASLILPLLSALGWDAADPDEVQYEFRRRPKDNPVDFALLLQRTPCLFVEAKPMGQDLSDRRWTNQVISYSTQAGVVWVVLTNGVEYDIYNANAPVPLEGKLFKRLSLTDTPMEELVRDLSLLSREDFVGKRIDRAWDAHHIDTQVRALLQRLFSEEGCDALAQLLSKMSVRTLSQAAVKESLLRADVRVSFPPAPLEPSSPPEEEDASAEAASGSTRGTATLMDLVEQGVLRPPVELQADYRGHRVTAIVTAGGQVELNGTRYSSPSTAAGMARLPHFEGDLKGRPYPQTNGWTFWRVVDPKSGELVDLDVLRRRLGR